MCCQREHIRLQISLQPNSQCLSPWTVHSGGPYRRTVSPSRTRGPSSSHQRPYTVYRVFDLTYPLTARVVGAPQMISHPVSSFFLCSLCFCAIFFPFHYKCNCFCHRYFVLYSRYCLSVYNLYYGQVDRRAFVS